MKNKRIIIVLLVAVMFVCAAFTVFAGDNGPILISPKPQEPAVSFKDIPQDAAYKEAVYKLVSNGVLNGYPDGTFRPAGNLTRAELCKMINLSMGYKDTTGAAGFPDLVTTEWYMPYILAAQKAGYILGDDTGLFRPNDNITRQEVCAILCRVLKPFDLQFEVAITDTVDDWAKDYVRLIVQNGLMPLEDGGTFRATEPIRRFELAVAVAPFSQKVQEVTCTVTYNVDGVLTTQEVVIGQTNPNPLVLATAPEGYKHVGWAIDPVELIPIDVPTYLYLEDVTLYPVYEKVSYNVIFMAGTVTADTQSVKHGEFAVVPNEPAMKGYTFKGWATGHDGKVVDVKKYAIKSDTVFNAVFAANDAGGGGFGGGSFGGGTISYVVKFVSGETQISAQSVESGKYASVPSEPTKAGYKFLHWSLSENGSKTEVSTYKITAATTFYAVFEKLPEKYDVIFMSGGSQVSKQSVEEGKKATEPAAPTLSGYKFLHWSLSQNGPKTEISSYIINGTTTFYAVFEKLQTEPDVPTPAKYEVVFISNGSQISKQTVEEGKKATAPANPTKDGYKFLYWSLEQEGSKTDVASYTINGATTFYAVFEYIPKYYDVTFISGGKQVSKQSVQEGKYASVPSAPTLDGYKFVHWSLYDGGIKTEVSNYKITGNTTFYAVFDLIPIVYYDVIFMSDGEQYVKQTVENETYATEPKAPTLDGYTFLYWSLEEYGNEVDVESKKITGKTIFYAVYELNKNNPNDPSVIESFEKAIPQFKAIRMTDSRHIRIRKIIVNTVQSVYDDAMEGIYVDKAYVNSVEEYRDAIDDVQDIVDNEMTDADISQFISLVRNNVDKTTFDILVDYFIDQKTQDKYLKS